MAEPRLQYFPDLRAHVGIYGVECNVMVAAEELGVKYEDIVVDFDYREAFTPMGGGSDGTTASSWVTKECANDLKKQILEAAVRKANSPAPAGGMMMMRRGPGGPPKENPLKGHTVEELDIVDGLVCLKADHSAGIPLAEATSENLFATPLQSVSSLQNLYTFVIWFFRVWPKLVRRSLVFVPLG